MVKRNDMDEFPRMTSRLLALEAAKNEKQQQQQHQETSNVASSRKVPKRKRLDEVKDTNFGTTSEQGEGRVKHEANLPSEQQIPDKKVLKFVIDVLQRKDKRGYFAAPVDGDEVEDYYDSIKEPMDFATMSAKLHEGNYITLKQFQDDVYLICNNAMSFNSSSTIYYREARAIHELADRIFSTLEANPEDIYKEFSKKIRLCQKTNCEAEASGVKRDKKAKGKRRAHKRSGLKIRTGVNFNEAGWRHTYQPSTSREETDVCSLKQLVLKNDHAIQKHGYKDSLTRFVRNLGPVAQKVANEKLILLNQMQSPSLLEPSRNETQEYVNYNDNVTENTMTPPTIHSSDPGQKGNMAETNYLGQLISDMPSFVGPISYVYPSTIVGESSLGLSGNMLQPSYSQNPYFQQLNTYQGVQQYNTSQSQSQSHSQDHDLHPGMMNPKI